jgi:hypothetical protein
MGGYYETSNPRRPTVDMDFGIADLDFQQAFKTFNTVKKLAPAAENIFGTFSATFKLKSDLDQHMQPIYANLFADGMMSIPAAEIKNIKALDQIADLVKKPEYKNLGFYKTKIAFKVENGRVSTKPFDVKMGGQVLTLSGSTGLDQSIDYTGTALIPKKDLGGADAAINGALAELNKAAGSNIKSSETLPVQIGIGGTFSNPKITTNFTDLAKGEANSIKDQALEEAKRKQKEMTDKAKAEMDKAAAEAKAKVSAEADKIKRETEAKAKAEADRLKAEAEAKVKAESNKIKNQAKDSVRNKLKGLLK